MCVCVRSNTSILYECEESISLGFCRLLTLVPKAVQSAFCLTLVSYFFSSCGVVLRSLQSAAQAAERSAIKQVGSEVDSPGEAVSKKNISGSGQGPPGPSIDKPPLGWAMPSTPGPGMEMDAYFKHCPIGQITSV